jgi:hypothetical protein
MYILTAVLSVLITVTLAAFTVLQLRNIAILYGFAFLIVVMQMVIDSISPILVQQVVSRDRLKLAYSRLSSAQLLAEAMALSVAGVFVSMGFGLPFLIQAIAIGIATVIIVSLRGNFQPTNHQSTPSFWLELAVGLKELTKARVVFTLVSLGAVRNLLTRMVFSVFVLYAMTTVHLSVQVYGVVSALFTVGGVIGSWAGPRLVRAFGYRMVLSGVFVLSAFGHIIVFMWPAVITTAIFEILTSFSLFVWNVTSTAVQRSLIPNDLQGRMGSALQFISWGTGPIGAFVGGVLASSAGLASPLWAAAIGMVLAGIATWWMVKDRDIITEQAQIQ